MLNILLNNSSTSDRKKDETKKTKTELSPVASTTILRQKIKKIFSKYFYYLLHVTTNYYIFLVLPSIYSYDW